MKVMSVIGVMMVMMSATQFAAGQGQQLSEQQRREQLRAAVQEICPVSGGMLGSMGEPIKVQVGQEYVFLCCKGGMEQKINPQHWATIHANFARAQRICPVMKQDLPKKPKWTVVEGQIVYVCCPPCTKKIAADPQKYLREIDQLYTAALDARKQAR